MSLIYALSDVVQYSEYSNALANELRDVSLDEQDLDGSSLLDAFK